MRRVVVGLALAAASVLPLAAQDAYLAERTRGRADAPITIYEVADFQCPACREFFLRTLPAVEAEYIATGKARIVFVNLPLVSIHPNAAAAHEFAMCAAAQDRFWPVHDLLYRNQTSWSALADPSRYFRVLADSAGVDPARLGSCVAEGAMRQLVLAEGQSAVSNGIRSTPSFVIEGGLLGGAVPITVLRPVLDSIYATKR